MIYCLVCGTANKDGSRFCDECGDQLAAQGAQRSDLPPWVAEMEKALRTQPKSDDDAEPQQIPEVPEWFLDLQASQPDRHVEDAFQLGVGEDGSVPAWLAPVQGRQTRPEPPLELAEPPQAQTDIVPAHDDTVQPESDTRPASTESQQAEPEPLHTAREPLHSGAQPPSAANSPREADQPPKTVAPRPQAETDVRQAGIDPSQHASHDRQAEDTSPRWLPDFHATEPVTETAWPSGESHSARVQGAGWLEKTEGAEGVGPPEASARGVDAAERSPDLPEVPRLAAREHGESDTIPESEDSGQLADLKLRSLRDRKAKLQDGAIAPDRSSYAGEWLRDLVEGLPVQAALVQGRGAALPETQSTTPDRFASRARVFSELVTHPPSGAPLVTGQPAPVPRSRLTRYAIFVVLCAIALCAILVIAFNARFSLLAGWIESTLENLGSLMGG